MNRGSIYLPNTLSILRRDSLFIVGRSFSAVEKAPEVVERWKKYYPLVQEVWRNARSHERLAAALITGPDPILRNWKDGSLSF